MLKYRMDFDLPPETIESVIFCMENQNETFLFDTERRCCVPASDAAKSTAPAGETLIPLPEWTPVHGFRLMDEFTGTVKNPALQKKLREATATRTGVFKRFREVLHEYPEFDRAWRVFKHKRMEGVVRRWHHTHALSQKLSELGEEPEEICEILRNDFVFGRTKPSPAFFAALKTPGSARASDGRAPAPEEIIAEGLRETLGETPAASRPALADLAARFLSGNADAMELFYAETPTGETAGAALTERFSDGGGNSALAITAAAVKPEFRGMGLFTQLLESVKNAAERRGDKAVYLVPVTLPFIKPVLERLDLLAESPRGVFFC